MKILVCGSRDWTDYDYVHHVLRDYEQNGDLFIIEGGARGADACARAFALFHLHEEQHVRVDAKWREHHPDWCPSPPQCRKDYCVGAGARRNQHMLDTYEPQQLVAFVCKPLEESRGTHDMVTRARKVLPEENIEIIERT